MATWALQGVPASDGGFSVASLRRNYGFQGVLYPAWHLLAPAGAIDPFAIWCAVGVVFVVATVLSARVPWLERRAETLFALCSWVVTLHLFLLAFLNDMHPFYAVGSVMTVLTAMLPLRSQTLMLCYAIFALLLAATLTALAPDTRKLAYWGGLFPVVSFNYYRLRRQHAAADLENRLQEQLRHAVEVRTRELREATEKLQQEMAERVRLEEALRFSHKMEAIGVLAGGIAHEFNNLLTTIGVYAELALRSLPEKGATAADIEQIEKARKQAVTLTRGLLAFGRPSKGMAEAVDLHEVVNTLAPMLRHLLPPSVRFEPILSGVELWIRADRDDLEQALVNLVLNARDAMPDGGLLRIETGLRRREEFAAAGAPNDLPSGEFVALLVTDTGIGMDHETRARAFDPFFTTKAEAGGTGLGLSVVYGTVRGAGGWLRVQSEPGLGARFELYWPRVAGAPSEERGPASARLHAGRERILLVEDRAELRGALQRVLASQGYRVTAAEDGRSALDAVGAAAEAFDLVVSDVVMPRLGGVELAEGLRERRYPTPVLLISAFTDHPSVRARALPPGVTLLTKPFAPQDLTSKVREILDGRAASASP